MAGFFGDDSAGLKRGAPPKLWGIWDKSYKQIVRVLRMFRVLISARPQSSGSLDHCRGANNVLFEIHILIYMGFRNVRGLS